MNAGGENQEQWAQTAMFTASEVEAQTGVPAATLRQWERRYGFPRPVRNDSGYRMYSPDDVRDIGIMLGHQRSGVGARMAAELTRKGMTGGGAGRSGLVRPVTLAPARQHALLAAPAASSPVPMSAPVSLPALAGQLTQALVTADYVRAGDVLAGAHARLPVEDVMTGVMSPALVEIGERWARGEITIAHERGASHFLRSRLSALMDIAGPEDTDTGWGPLLVAACAPGEQHELGLMMQALALRRRGLRVAYLGANVPLGDLTIFAHERGAQAILLSINGEWALGDWGNGAWVDGAWVADAPPDRAVYPASRPVRTGTHGLAWVSGSADQAAPQPQRQRPVCQRTALQRLGLPVFLGGALMNARPALAAELGGLYAGPDAPAAAATISGVLGHALHAAQAADPDREATPSQAPHSSQAGVNRPGPDQEGEQT
ncbi:hypothetical protein GCM10010840_06710 [Deinococcus aerolatus]|uniref:HTH merR-type domain-containing protein n=1 Tax=Deinococcus aerolatus TaxID=522487 RepID=A0ABQ2G291_9DEIO|nr:B12-binding domain-containing protein [Deinococcus aerolatus]GGL71248.1 hypothetical protein GCM10010840_06710 [Deinococcus aerolatus]